MNQKSQFAADDHLVFPIMFICYFFFSFVGRLFRHALEDSRPKSVLVNSLSVCISLLDPKRLLSASNHLFRSQLSHGSLVTASPETVDGMLGSLGNWLLGPSGILLLASHLELPHLFNTT